MATKAQGCKRKQESEGVREEAIGNGIVDWNSIDKEWSDIGELFKFQKWRDFFTNSSFPYYDSLVKSVISNMVLVCEEKNLYKSSFNNASFELSPSKFDQFVYGNEMVNVKYDDVLCMLPSKNVFECESIDWERFVFVMTGKKTKCGDENYNVFPSFKSLTVVAKGVDKIVSRCVIPRERRCDISHKRAWVVYHILERRMISLGHVWIDLLLDAKCKRRKEELIRNPGFLTWYMQKCGISLSNVVPKSLKCTVIDAKFMAKSFEKVGNEWRYRHEKSEEICIDKGESSRPSKTRRATLSNKRLQPQNLNSGEPSPSSTSFSIPQTLELIMSKFEEMDNKLNDMQQVLNSHIQTTNASVASIHRRIDMLENDVIYRFGAEDGMRGRAPRRDQDTRGDHNGNFRQNPSCFLPYPNHLANLGMCPPGFGQPSQEIPSSFGVREPPRGSREITREVPFVHDLREPTHDLRDLSQGDSFPQGRQTPPNNSNPQNPQDPVKNKCIL